MTLEKQRLTVDMDIRPCYGIQ